MGTLLFGLGISAAAVPGGDPIGVATRVLATPLRPPPVVAKMAESRDRLSGGRNFLPSGPDATEQAERLAREVLPAVRAGAPA